MKKIFTLIALGAMALTANAQDEKVLFEYEGTYVDEQIITSENTQLQLGKDIKKATKWDNKASSSTEYLAPFTQTVQIKNEETGVMEDKDRFIYISGGNNPKDLEDNGKGDGFDGSGETGRLPRSGTYYMITPSKNGTVLVGVILNADKEFFVVDGTDAVEGEKLKDGEVVGMSLNVVNADAVIAPADLVFVDKDGNELTPGDGGKGGVMVSEKFTGTVQFEAKANHTYYVFCTGSKLGCFGYVFTPSGDEETTDLVIWENSDPEGNGVVNWSGAYRFALDGKDGANECIATFPEEIWNRIKTEPFYMQFSGDLYQIRVTTGWWDAGYQWLGDNEDIGYWGNYPELVTDNGDGSYNLEVNFDGAKILELLDDHHLLFTGTGYTPLKLFFKGTATGIQNVKTTVNTENGAIYNLAGQRVDASYKGIVIQNGRKFINK